MMKTIDDYIAEFPEEKQAVLQRIRSVICEAVPTATEKISYQMPAFWQGEVLIWFAGMKEHIGIYPTNSGIAAFADEIAPYKPSKGTFRIPWGADVPYGLIAEIVRFRAAEVKEKRDRTVLSKPPTHG